MHKKKVIKLCHHTLLWNYWGWVSVANVRMSAWKCEGEMLTVACKCSSARVEQMLLSSKVHNWKRFFFLVPLCCENLSRFSSRKLWWLWDFQVGCHKTAVHLPRSKYLPWYHCLVVQLSPFVSVLRPDQCHSQCILKHSDIICFILNISNMFIIYLIVISWYGYNKWEPWSIYCQTTAVPFCSYLSWRYVFVFAN